MQAIIQKIHDRLKLEFAHDASGHDFWHMYRVWKLSQHLQKEEGGDQFVVELTALLHDIADWKYHDGDETVGPKTAKNILTEYQVNQDVIDHVSDIIATMSYKGAGVATPMKTIEGMIVQDADRLDAIGAIGIGRTFAYGGYKGTPMHDPDLSPVLHASKDAYFTHKGTTINHFHEKLLLLKDRMNTETAQKMAHHRHAYMEQFLKEFDEEWAGRL